MCSGEMTLKTVIGLQRSEQDIINEMTEVVIICYIDEVTKQFCFTATNMIYLIYHTIRQYVLVN